MTHFEHINRQEAGQLFSQESSHNSGLGLEWVSSSDLYRESF